MNILTRGFGRLAKIITRGYGPEPKEGDVGGGRMRPFMGRVEKKYSMGIYASIQKHTISKFNIYAPIKRSLERTIKVYSRVSKSITKNVLVVVKTSHKKLFEMIDAI